MSQETSTSPLPRSTASRQLHGVVISVGTAGDIHPFLAVSKALQGRGHRVTFLAPAPYERHARLAGVPFHPLGTEAEFQAVLEDPDLWDTRKAFGVIWRHLRDRLHMGADFLDALPSCGRCVLFVHPLLLPVVGLMRGRRPDLSVVGAYLAPSNLRSSHDPSMTLGPLRIPAWVPVPWRRWLWARVEARYIDPIALPDLNAQRASLGLPAVAGFIDHLQSVPDLSVALFPEWFAATQPDWPRPMERTPFPLFDPHPGRQTVPELADFLSAGAPPVVFTAGTGHQHATRFFAVALEAVARLGARAILLTGHRAQLPPSLPQGVLWQSYLPFKALLPRVSVLVHHGGIGTTAEALRAGVPQLVVPFAHDQFDNGERVRALGVGRVLPAAGLRIGRMVKALMHLSTSADVHDRCVRVAERFDPHAGLDALCGAIERLVPEIPQSSGPP